MLKIFAPIWLAILTLFFLFKPEKAFDGSIFMLVNIVCWFCMLILLLKNISDE